MRANRRARGWKWHSGNVCGKRKSSAVLRNCDHKLLEILLTPIDSSRACAASAPSASWSEAVNQLACNAALSAVDNFGQAFCAVTAHFGSRHGYLHMEVAGDLLL